MSNIFYIIGLIIVLTNINVVLHWGSCGPELVNFDKKPDSEQKRLLKKHSSTCLIGIMEFFWIIYACCFAPNSFYFTIYFGTMICIAFLRAIFKIKKSSRTYISINRLIAAIAESWLMYNCYTSF